MPLPFRTITEVSARVSFGFPAAGVVARGFGFTGAKT
jgi:hypothetical protein